MVRIARVVAEHYPHHITQRGNRRQDTFFCDDDYRYYIHLMGEWCDTCGVEIWAYCLMSNHVHLIAVPESEDGLRRAIGEAHRRYTRHINFREKWRGHLWQGRFASFLMDEQYLLTATRYIELNPVRAGLSSIPEEYPWSSAEAHIKGENDDLVKVNPLLGMVGDWRQFLSGDVSDEEYGLLQRHERTGRPLGSKSFVERLENKLTRILTPQKGGRPKKD
ncbi:MAG: transposase [Syntrophales bacterium]|nr:transposase [Syntrophales bacterium]